MNTKEKLGSPRKERYRVVVALVKEQLYGAREAGQPGSFWVEIPKAAETKQLTLGTYEHVEKALDAYREVLASVVGTPAGLFPGE